MVAAAGNHCWDYEYHHDTIDIVGDGADADADADAAVAVAVAADAEKDAKKDIDLDSGRKEEVYFMRKMMKNVFQNLLVAYPHHLDMVDIASDEDENAYDDVRWGSLPPLLPRMPRFILPGDGDGDSDGGDDDDDDDDAGEGARPTFW